MLTLSMLMAPFGPIGLLTVMELVLLGIGQSENGSPFFANPLSPNMNHNQVVSIVLVIRTTDGLMIHAMPKLNNQLRILIAKFFLAMDRLDLLMWLAIVSHDVLYLLLNLLLQILVQVLHLPFQDYLWIVAPLLEI